MERDKSHDRKRLWVTIGVVIAAGHIAYAAWRVSVGHADLIDFHDTSLHFWSTGEFTQAFGVRHYLPAFVVLVAPLVIWPLPVTAPLWAAINVTLLVLTVHECGRLAAARYQAKIPFHLRWVWPIVLILPYASSTLSLGQVNLLVLFLCVLAYSRCWQQRRDVLAGVLIAVAAVIKLYPLLLALFWLTKGRWRGFASAVVGFAVLACGLSLAAFGWEGSLRGHRAWWAEVRGEQYRSAAEKAHAPGLADHLLYRQERNQFHRHNNQSLAAVIRRLTTDLGSDPDQPRPVHVLSLSVGSAWRLYIGSAGALLGLLLWIAWAHRRDGECFGEFSAWLASVIAFVPIYWTHYFVLVLPAVTLLSVTAWWDRRQGRCRTVGNSRNSNKTHKEPRASDRAGGRTRTIVAVRLEFLLQAGWLAGIPMLASTTLRLAGVHCWLTLAVAIWAAARFGFRAPGLNHEPNCVKPRDTRGDPSLTSEHFALCCVSHPAWHRQSPLVSLGLHGCPSLAQSG